MAEEEFQIRKRRKVTFNFGVEENEKPIVKKNFGLIIFGENIEKKVDYCRQNNLEFLVLDIDMLKIDEELEREDKPETEYAEKVMTFLKDSYRESNQLINDNMAAYYNLMSKYNQLFQFANLGQNLRGNIDEFVYRFRCIKKLMAANLENIQEIDRNIDNLNTQISAYEEEKLSQIHDLMIDFDAGMENFDSGGEVLGTPDGASFL